MDLVPPNIKKGKQPKALDRGQCLAGAYGSGVCGILASTGCGFIFLAKWPPTLPPTRPDRIFPDLYSSQGRAEMGLVGAGLGSFLDHPTAILISRPMSQIKLNQGP